MTLLGVALGVSVLVSIRLANRSALSGFERTIDAVAGRASLQITSDQDGLDEKLYPLVRALPDVQAAAPVLQTYVLANLSGAFDEADPEWRESVFGDTLLLLGLDAFNEDGFGRLASNNSGAFGEIAFSFLDDPRAVAMPDGLARRHGLQRGDEFQILVAGRRETLRVGALLESEQLTQAFNGNVLLMDIGGAQEVLQRYGRLDRIDLIVPEDRHEAVIAAVQPLLPRNVRIGRSESRTQQVENMISAFQLSLSALSVIALFVATFLIFNAVSLAVLRRRREIGILRGLGVTRRQILTLFLSEALSVGVIGAVLGLGLGTLLARVTLTAVSRTLSELYLIVEAGTLVYDPAIYAHGLALGIACALLSAIPGAVEASRVPPLTATRQGEYIEAQGLPIGRWTAAGVGLLALAAIVALITIRARAPQGGFFSAGLSLLGFSLLAPAATLLVERLFRRLVRRLAGIEGALGASYLRATVARTSVVVAALMVSVGMMVSLSIMVRSFRSTVDIWVQQTMKGDIYVEPVGRRVTGSATAINAEIIDKARSTPGVAAVDTYRSIQITHRGRVAYVSAIDFDVHAAYGQLTFTRGKSREVIEKALREQGVLATESFAFWNRLEVGDTVELETPSGPVALPVIGIFYDYSTDTGALLMDRRLFARLWQDDRTESLALYLEPGADAEQVQREYLAALGGKYVLAVTPNQDLRERIMMIFDQTFQITYALQSIAILVAVLGVINTLTTLVTQRARDFGVLRAVGALRSQIRKMVLVESALVGVIGSLLGCLCGAALSVLLIYVINKQFFGWSIHMTMEPRIFLESAALIIVTAVLAGIVPARLASGRLGAEAMRMD